MRWLALLAGVAVALQRELPHDAAMLNRGTRIVGLIALLAVFSLLGCASAQRPYQFVASGNAGEPLSALVQALALQGKEAAQVDPAAGVIHTTWEDTGFMFGEIDGMTATIVRRFTVVVRTSGAGHTVIVRLDGRRCATGGYTIAGLTVSGRCETMNNVVPAHQDELDALGAQLQQALGGASSAAAPAPAAGGW